MKVGIIGLGYVGLPLCVEFAESGLQVTGFDVAEGKVADVNASQSYIPDIPSERLTPLIKSGHLYATSDFSALKEIDAVCICVPTPLRKTMDPDISYIVSAAERIREHLHKGQVVVLESTTYPGTTAELVLPMLEETGLKVGEDFYLAFSPERVNPGDKKYMTRNTPKVIGGTTPACTEKAVELYSHAVDTLVPVSSPIAAEMVKLLENTFRAINIGLVNELAVMCDHLDVDVWEVINAAKTKPFGFMPFFPGPGLGGHCIPIDPLYLSWKLKTFNYTARFIELATNINSNMQQYVVGKINDALNDDSKSVRGSKILILGVAYKADVTDTRESPAMDVMGLLHERGAEIAYSDPNVPQLEFLDMNMESYALERGVADFDCVAVLTDHSAFDYARDLSGATLVYDARNALDGVELPDTCRVVKL